MDETGCEVGRGDKSGGRKNEKRMLVTNYNKNDHLR